MHANHLPGKLGSAREVADFYGIGLSTLWRWLKLGLIPEPIRIGRRTFWEMAVLEQHIASLRVQRPAA